MMYLITEYPFARREGYIEVPDDVENPYDFIADNYDDIEFGEPELTPDFNFEYEPL